MAKKVTATSPKKVGAKKVAKKISKQLPKKTIPKKIAAFKANKKVSSPKNSKSFKALKLLIESKLKRFNHQAAQELAKLKRKTNHQILELKKQLM
jgi:hypothetical protein